MPSKLTRRSFLARTVTAAVAAVATPFLLKRRIATAGEELIISLPKGSSVADVTEAALQALMQKAQHGEEGRVYSFTSVGDFSSWWCTEWIAGEKNESGQILPGRRMIRFGVEEGDLVYTVNDRRYDSLPATAAVFKREGYYRIEWWLLASGGKRGVGSVIAHIR